MRNRPLRIALLASFTVVLGTARVQASACLVDIAPPDGATVPANVPALHYTLLGGPAGTSAPQGIQLVSDAGTPVPVVVKDDPYYGYRIELMTEPAMGGYTLRYPDPCAGPTAFAQEHLTFGPERPLPTSAPQVVLTPFTADIPYQCHHEPFVLRNHPGLDVGIQLSRDWQEFLPVVSFESLVDGFEWGLSPYGELTTGKIDLGDFRTQRPADKVYGTCGGRGEGPLQDECPINFLGLDEGMHTLQVRVILAGASSDPVTSAASDFTITCPAGTGGAGGASGAAGSSGAGGAAGVGGAAGTGAGAKGGGCALVSGGSVAGAWPLLLVVGWCTLRRAGRRRSP